MDITFDNVDNVLFIDVVSVLVSNLQLVLNTGF